MAGPAIRAYQLARVLADDAQVTIAGPAGSTPPDDDRLLHVSYQPHSPRALRAPIAAADAIVAQPQWPLVTSWMRRSGARLIFDLFVPEALEALQRYPRRGSWRARLLMAYMGDRLADALRSGHHFVCAGERQRALWIGAMLADGLLTPELSERDPSLRSVIDLAPFGTPPERAVATGAGGARARFPAIGADDEIVLWNSAVWPWFDAATAIRAITQLRERRPRVRLVFMGQASAGPSAQAADAARSLAGELGVLDTHVFFNDRWVPYAARVDWLLEASCAVSTHFDHLETEFAFRSRYLDCFWARLPIVCTGGDELADVIARDDLGEVVPEQDPGALADALESVLARGRAAYEPALAAAAERYAWSASAAPLARFIQSPLPPRLGEHAPARGAGHLTRSALYRAGRAGLAAIGATRASRALSAPEG
ncbi:MAG TPA: glycosyltransferase [Thermoleophilaceae bacterium]